MLRGPGKKVPWKKNFPWKNAAEKSPLKKTTPKKMFQRKIPEKAFSVQIIHGKSTK